jgi:hypothetical protein
MGWGLDKVGSPAAVQAMTSHTSFFGLGSPTCLRVMDHHWDIGPWNPRKWSVMFGGGVHTVCSSVTSGAVQ